MRQVALLFCTSTRQSLLCIHRARPFPLPQAFHLLAKEKGLSYCPVTQEILLIAFLVQCGPRASSSMQTLPETIPVGFLLIGGYGLAAYIDVTVESLMAGKESSNEKLVVWAKAVGCDEERPVSATHCCTAYLCAAAAGGMCSFASEKILGCTAVWSGLAGCVASTVVTFGFSFASNNSSVYDPYWCIMPQGLSLWWAYKGGGLLNLLFNPTKALPFFLLHAWAFRYHIQRPWVAWWKGLREEDWRYNQFRHKLIKSPAMFWAFSFTSFHLTPSMLVFAALLPLAKLLSNEQHVQPTSTAHISACLLSLGTICWHFLAEKQLIHFWKTEEYTLREPLEKGLWRYSRCESLARCLRVYCLWLDFCCMICSYADAFDFESDVLSCVLFRKGSKLRTRSLRQRKIM